MSDLSRLGRIYQGEVVRLLERYPNARAQGQLHSLDYMIVKDLAHTYPTATGRELQRAMIEGSPHIHERTSWHIDDDTRRTVCKAWEDLGREPEPWMRAEGAAAAARAEQTPGRDGVRPRCWRACCRSKGGLGHGQGAKGDEGRGCEGRDRDGRLDR